MALFGIFLAPFMSWSTSTAWAWTMVPRPFNMQPKCHGPQRHRATTRAKSLWTSFQDEDNDAPIHVLMNDQLKCQERCIEFPTLGKVRVLEATEESQEHLEQTAMAIALNLATKNDDDKPLMKEGDVYGATVWPSSSAVAKYLLEQKQDWSNTTVVELGAGPGLVSIVAALKGAHVIATDLEPFPLEMARYAASTFHNVTLETQILDLCDYEKTPLPTVDGAADIVVAADVNYLEETAVGLAHRTAQALAQGSRVIIGDSPERPGRPVFLETLQELTGINVEQDVPIIESSGVALDLGHELPVTILDIQPTIVQKR